MFSSSSIGNQSSIFPQIDNNILEENFISFYNRDLKAPTPDLTGYNNELKSKILNKIESNLWFKTDAPQGFNTK